MDEIKWSLQLLARIAAGNPDGFVRAVLASGNDAGLLVCQTFDMLVSRHSDPGSLGLSYLCSHRLRLAPNFARSKQQLISSHTLLLSLIDEAAMTQKKSRFCNLPPS